MKCPHKGSKEWKELVAELGETLAYAAYNRNDEDIPSVNKAKALFGMLSKPTKESIKDSLVKKGLVDKYLTIKSNRVGKEIDRINQELQDNFGESPLSVDGKRVKFDKSFFDSGKASTGNDLSSIFNGEATISAQQALENVVKNPSTAVSGLVAKRLLNYVDLNNVEVNLHSSEYMADNFTINKVDANGNTKKITPRGIYFGDSNVIHISETAPVSTLVHEILHALSAHHLERSNPESRQLKKLYSHILENHPELTSDYAMLDIDEFMVGIFTDKEFIGKLKSLPTSGVVDINKKNLWDEILDILARIFKLSSRQVNSLYEEAMSSAISVLDGAKQESDMLGSMFSEVPISEEDSYERVYASPETVEDESEFVFNEEISEEAKVLNVIRDRLNKLIAIHGKRITDRKTATTVSALEKLRDKVKATDALKGIQEYIHETAKIIKEFEANMQVVKDDPDNIEHIDRLTSINGFISSFDNLRRIRTLGIITDTKEEDSILADWLEESQIADSEGRYEEFIAKKPKPIGTKNVLSNAVDSLDRLHMEYLDYGIPLIAKKLFSLLPQETIENNKKLKAKRLLKNDKDSKALSIVTTEKELAEQMRLASRDISGYERWLCSSLGGTNPLISLTAMLVKDNLSELSDELTVDEEQLGQAFEKYKKGKSVNNVKEFNSKFIEEVDRLEKDGSVTKVKHFVTKYDKKAYNNARNDYYRSIEHLRSKNKAAHEKLINKWYAENSIPLSEEEAQKIIEYKKSVLTEYQFNIWKGKNTDKNGRYIRDLAVPSDKYISERYRELQKDTEAFAYYEVLYSKFQEIKKLLPPVMADKMGDRIPSVYKADWEFAQEGKIGKVVRDKFNINSSDTNYGLTTTGGKEFKEIPIFFAQEMPSELTSDDLLQSILKAGKNWREYNHKAKIQSEIQLIRDINDHLAVTKTNAKGEAKYDPTSINKVLTKEVTSNIQQRLNETLDNIYFGLEDEKTLVNLPLVGEVSVDKLTNTMLAATSAISLSGNWISGISNVVMGNIMNFTEAHAGEFISKKNLEKGHTKYAKNIHNVIADRGKLTDKHWLTKVTEEYDFIQGDFVDNFGENISGNRLKRELDTSNLFLINNAGEHQIQVSAGLAFLDSVKWIDGHFVSRVDYKGDKKIFETAKSLLDLYEEGNGRLALEYKAAWSREDRQRLRNRIHETNKYLHGNYAKFDKTTLQRMWYGKLAIMFRKFVVSGAARRFGDTRVNLATGTIMEGNYRTLVNFLIDTIKEMKSNGLKEALGVYKNLEPYQRANMRKTIVEAVALFTMILIVNTVGGDDEEKNSYAENLLLLEARRLQSELAFYVSPLESFRMLKSPTVTMSTVEAAIKFSHGIMFVYGEDDKYKRDTGIWDKGDDKDLARLVKLIPVLKSILAGMSPDEQYKTFNKLL